jgi:hypothetical protein
MKNHEWLTAETIASENFRARGGLAAMGRQSARCAHEYGGVSTIRLEESQFSSGIQRATVRVTFKDDVRRRVSPALAEREEIVWRLVARKVRGVWLFALE